MPFVEVGARGEVGHDDGVALAEVVAFYGDARSGSLEGADGYDFLVPAGGVVGGGADAYAVVAGVLVGVSCRRADDAVEECLLCAAGVAVEIPSGLRGVDDVAVARCVRRHADVTQGDVAVAAVDAVDDKDGLGVADIDGNL